LLYCEELPLGHGILIFRSRVSRIKVYEYLPPMGIDDMSLEHMANWFDCMRSRKQPDSPVHDGFAHSVACIMAAQSYWEGRKLYWEAANAAIVDRAPVTSKLE
jgi:hypothetical protein